MILFKKRDGKPEKEDIKIKILFLSSHEVLEFDELKLLSELDSFLPDDQKLNIECFSMGAYTDPRGGRLRSIVPKMQFNQELYGIAMQCDKNDLHPLLVDWADTVIFMHNSALPGQKFNQRWIHNYYDKFENKKKQVVFRSIGQSTPDIERELILYKKKGLKIVRYSPLEALLPDFAGQDAVIRFYKDPEEFKGWTGEKKQVITIAQSFKKRGHHLGYDLFEKATYDFNCKVYGTENEDLGEVWGGQRSYEELKQDLRQARVFFYTGTKPASYTLSFIEALMIGVPVVAVGSKLREDNEPPYKWRNYEIPDIINNGLNGFISNSIEDLRGYIDLLLNNDDVAQRISKAGRKTALKLFDRNTIAIQWIEFLRNL